MSTENDTPVETVEDDLDLFSSQLFSQKPLESEPAKSDVEEVEDSEQEVDAPNTEETQTDDEDPDDALAPEEEDSNEEPADKAAPKKNRFQERINELVAKARESERREQALQEQLAALSKAEPKPTPDVPAKVDPVSEAPDPFAKNEDGTDKYPLGEFDPTYNKDLVEHLFDKKVAQREAVEREAQIRKQDEEVAAALTQGWSEQLANAQERYPDFQEKGRTLAPIFDGVNEQYSTYLTTAIMSMENGTDVLYYLANNPEEAQRIIDSGPTRATIALGRIEAAFLEDEPVTPTTKRPIVSKAPAPPPTNKGSSAVTATIPVDTDDLDAFSKLLFKKK